MSALASQITSLTIVYSTDYPGADQRKHQSSASLAFVRGIHRWPVNSPHKGLVTWKMFPFDDVIMKIFNWILARSARKRNKVYNVYMTCSSTTSPPSGPLTWKILYEASYEWAQVTVWNKMSAVWVEHETNATLNKQILIWLKYLFDNIMWSFIDCDHW